MRSTPPEIATTETVTTVVAVDMTGMESDTDLALVIENNTPAGTLRRLDVLSDLTDRPTDAPLAAVADAYARGLASITGDHPVHIAGLCSASLLTLAIADGLERQQVIPDSVILVNPRRPEIDRASEAFDRARSRLHRGAQPPNVSVPWGEGIHRAIPAVRRILTDETRRQMAATQLSDDDLDSLVGDLVGRQVAWIWLLLASHEAEPPVVTAPVIHVSSLKEADAPPLHLGVVTARRVQGEIPAEVLGHQNTGALFRELGVRAAG